MAKRVTSQVSMAQKSSLTGGSSKLMVTESLAKVSKTTFSLMEKRQLYRVVENEIDVTPDDITDPLYAVMDDTITHVAFDVKNRDRSERALKDKATASTADVCIKVYATTISLDDISIDYTLNTEEGFIPNDIDLEIAPSAFSLPKITPIMSYPPEVFIVLKETETSFLFGLPSLTCEKGTPESAIVEENNEFYQYITVGKGRNRRMITEETQTNAVITQSRHTLGTRPQKKNAAAFASLWDMHDTYAHLAKEKQEESPDEMVMHQTTEPTFLRQKKQLVTYGLERQGKTFEEISLTPQFLDAVLLTKRVLANLKYSNAQKKFRGLVSTDPLSLDLVYVYSMKPLWSLECNEALNRPITSISFNSKNENILAVGHGKFTYAEHRTGLICIWCTKNPCEPERFYYFSDPVSSIAFSDNNPNWLACGFTNGDVLILDITSYTTKVIAKSIRETNPCFEPIWCISWRKLDRYTEFVMTAGQDGRINKFTSSKTHDFICVPMMRISTVEGKLKGIEVPKYCVKEDVPIVMHPAALCVMWHPSIDHIYIVGTDEGCVHKCSIHYLNQHIDVFRAHAGPVYRMQFSPFMKTLLATSGADNAVRLWLEGIDDVILTLNCPAAVYDIAFCPINSTIILTASGNVLSIWDLRRKTHMPCAEHTFPGQVVLTYIKFSPSGDNVFVGDTLGRVHTYHLEDTPIPPYYQKKLLDETIKKALCTRPQILKQLEKLEKFSNKF